VSGAASDSLNQRAASLVPSVRAGNPEALGSLYDLTARRLRLVAQRALVNDADAEDLVHDLFVGLPEALRHYRESGRFMSWLVTCTMRLALMRRRAGARRRESALDDAAEQVTGAAAVDRPDLAPEVDEAYRRIAALPESLRDVVLLRSEGLTHAEIAASLGISEGNSRIRLARALERLLPQSVGMTHSRVHTEDRPHD
jgi:RNA polymerase sigma-70 factor (ECF subfamily)